MSFGYRILQHYDAPIITFGWLAYTMGSSTFSSLVCVVLKME